MKTDDLRGRLADMACAGIGFTTEAAKATKGEPMKRFCFVCLPVLFALGCAEKPAQETNATVPTIPVVKTWGDLLEQPQIPAGPGTARLGVEARRVPYGGGVLLYCVTEGYSLPEKWSELRRLGPFKVDVRHEHDTGPGMRSLSQAVWDPPDIADSTALFRLSIPLDRPGRFLVRVLTLDGEPVGEAEITATDEKFHAWMPLAPATMSELETGRDEYDAAGHVRNRGKGIAIPSFDGMAPLLFPGDGSTAKATGSTGVRLPTLLPTGAGAGLTVRAMGTDLAIESREDINLSRPDWHFLARWWVNGEPYAPEQLDPFGDMNGVTMTGRKLLLRLDFDPSLIGAGQGDEVELQLLYCRDGWEFVGPGAVAKLAHSGAEGPELLLSNRVRLSWEKSGDSR